MFTNYPNTLLCTKYKNLLKVFNLYINNKHKMKPSFMINYFFIINKFFINSATE